MNLELLSDTFAVCRLGPNAAVPPWAWGSFAAVTRTPEELSIVCLESNVPDQVRAERGWRCLRFAGSLDFSLTNIIAPLTTALSTARISVFVISTFETDYVLVKEAQLVDAINVLAATGYEIRPV